MKTVGMFCVVMLMLAVIDMTAVGRAEGNAVCISMP